MPSLQDLGQFRNSFRSIGGELGAISDKGQEYSDLPLPEQGLDEGLAALLGEKEEPEEPSLESDTPSSTDGAAFDFSAFLDSIPDDLSAPPEGMGESLPPPPESVEDEESGIPPGLLDGFADEIETERAGASGSDAQDETFSFDQDQAGGDDFALPDLSGIETADVEETAAPDSGTQPPDFSLDSFDLGSPGDFGASGLESTSSERSPDSPSPLDFGGDFSPDFLAEEPSDVPPSPSPESSTPEAEPGAGEESPFDDSFSLPDFDMPLEGEAPAEEAPSSGLESDAGFGEEPFSLFSEEGGEEALGAGEVSPPVPEKEPFDFTIPDFSEPSTSNPPSGETGEPDFSATFPEGDQDFGGGFEPDSGGASSASLPSSSDSFPEAADEASLDSFDTFSLDDSFANSGFGISEEKPGASPGAEGFGQLEDFSLEGIDSLFGGSAQGKTAAAPGRPVASSRKGAPAHSEVEEINLSEDDYRKLERSLDSYPLNLRVACEELIAEQAVAPDQMSALIKMLIRAAPAKDCAQLVSKLLGRSIPIPRGFEKSSGATLEAEQSTFYWAFTHNILPVLQMFAFVAVSAAALCFLGFNYIYKPLHSSSLYAEGYALIGQKNWNGAVNRFDEASLVWRQKKWYFRYADAFEKEGQYQLARQKYAELLHFYDRDKQGILSWAAMETRLFNFEGSRSILQTYLLDFHLNDLEGLLALGDNFMAWGDFEQTPALSRQHWEDARKAWARLMDEHGRKDAYLERMLKYFIRIDSLKEVLPLENHFLSSKKRKISADSLAELGGYLIDKKFEESAGIKDLTVEKIDRIRDVLTLAIRKDQACPEAWYHLSRYLERLGKPSELFSAAEQAVGAFEKAPERTSRRIGYRIDAQRRYAFLLLKKKDFLTSEEALKKGIGIYEDALRRQLLKPSGTYGRLYADLGDINYFKSGDLVLADELYETARQNLWAPPEVIYRRGYIAYIGEDWGRAVDLFFEASDKIAFNRRLLFAMGNALFRRGDLQMAQGCYTRVLDILEKERISFPVLNPAADPAQAQMVERLMRARNNLGVTLMALADRTGNAVYRSQALSLYAESARAWDALARDPVSMIRSESANQAFLNTRGALRSETDYEAQIFTEIDKDVLAPSFWEKLLSD